MTCCVIYVTWRVLRCVPKDVRMEVLLHNAHATRTSVEPDQRLFRFKSEGHMSCFDALREWDYSTSTLTSTSTLLDAQQNTTPDA